MPLSVFNLDAFYFSRGAKNIINLASALSKWQKDNELEYLFTEAMEVLQRGSTPEETAFYGTIVLSIAGEVFNGERYSEAINLVLGILEQADAKTFSALAESMISQGDTAMFIVITNIITSGKHGDLLKGDLLKAVFNGFIKHWGYLSEIQQADFEQVIKKGIKDLDNFKLSPNEKALINLELLNMSIMSNHFKMRFNLDPVSLIENIDLVNLDSDTKRDIVDGIIVLQRTVFNNIRDLRDIAAIENKEAYIQDLKTLRLNLIKKILPVIKESKNSDFNIKLIQEDMGFTEEELKSLGLEKSTITPSAGPNKAIHSSI